MRKPNTGAIKRATRETTRDINRQIALNLIREHQPISRAELARKLSLNRGSVTFLVNDLLSRGAVVEGECATAPRGRRPKMLYIRSHDRLVVGVDVRSSVTYLMLSDFSYREIAVETMVTPSDPEAFVQQLAHRVRELASRCGDGGTVEGVGLVIPGMVEQETGRVLNAPQLGWRNADIREHLAAATGYPISIENASVACALARMWSAGKEEAALADFVYVNVSDGVGTAVVVGGQIMRGVAASAGEFGHIPLHPAGPPCRCGARGCLEAYASNLATLGRYSAGQGESGSRPAELTVAELVSRARSGDRRARQAILKTGRYLGAGVSVIVNALNPARIVLGGEITEAWDWIHPQIRAAVQARALTDAAGNTPIEPDRTALPPRLLGATALVAAPMYAIPTFI